MFGGEHVIVCREPGEDGAPLWVYIDGQAHRPRSWRGLMRMVCRRVMRRNGASLAALGTRNQEP